MAYEELKQFTLGSINPPCPYETHLAKLPTGTANRWPPPRELLLALSLPNTTDETGQRFLKGCIITKHPSAVGSWLGHGAPS